MKVPSEAAAKLFMTDAEHFNSLLRKIPREQDLWQVRRLDVDVGSPADGLHRALRKMLPAVDWVTAGKLIAAKRPRLIPILDSRVQNLLRSPQELLVPSTLTSTGLGHSLRRAIGRAPSGNYRGRVSCSATTRQSATAYRRRAMDGYCVNDQGAASNFSAR